MNWKKTTVIVILTMFFIVAVYDVLAIQGGGVEASISHTMIVWAYHFPLFPFLMGVLTGHLFWRMHDTEATAQIAKDITGTNK
jgi:hypothetical protein